MSVRLSLARWVLGAWLLLLAGLAGALTPPFEVLRQGLKPSNVVLLDRHGDPISEIFRPSRGLRLEWTPLRTLPDEMLRTLLVAEDKRFFEHSGVDYRAFVAALWQNLWYERKRGASTLSMQLAGLLDPALHPSSDHGGRRTIGQKWDQSLAAGELEASWSKEQILEAYLNLVYFRGRLQGIAAASWGLFEKPPVLLTRAEAAILSALLRGPNARLKVVRRRACQLLERMSVGRECAELDALMPRLRKPRVEPRWDLAPKLARRSGASAGARIATTLAPAWQRAAVAALEAGVAAKAAIVVLGPAGEIAAYAARAGALEGDPPPDVALPLALANAIEGRRLTAASLLLRAGSGQSRSEPWVSARTALAGNEGGLRQTLTRALAREMSRASATLGGLGIGGGRGTELSAVAALFSALAGDGRWRAPRWRASHAAHGARPLMSAEAAFIVADMLAAHDAGGCVRSFEMRSAERLWLAGLIGGHAVALRLDGSDMAATARAMFDALAGSEPARRGCRAVRVRPERVLRSWVSFEPAVEPARGEWFVRGTEATRSRAPLAAARIVWPRDKSIVDGRRASVEARFEVVFEAYPELAELRWLINGVEIGRGGRVGWRPRTGLFQLELVTPQGQLIDRVEFAARGPL